MTAHAARIPAGHYRFRHVARMEWIKLRSLRSTWWTLLITAAGDSNDVASSVARAAVGSRLTSSSTVSTSQSGGR